jgi:hypothetical protein
MDAITLGLQGQQARNSNRLHKYQVLSDATVLMLADDMDVNRMWIILMGAITAGYHFAVTSKDYTHPTVNSGGWNLYRMTAALRELAQGEAPNTSEEYTRGYGDACHQYGHTGALAVIRPENAYERGWNQAIRDLAPKFH